MRVEVRGAGFIIQPPYRFYNYFLKEGQGIPVGLVLYTYKQKQQTLDWWKIEYVSSFWIEKISIGVWCFTAPYSLTISDITERETTNYIVKTKRTDDGFLLFNLLR